MTKSARFMLRLEPGLHTRLMAAAEARGTTATQIITDALVAHLSRFDPNQVLGYVQVVGGEAVGAECPECGQPMAETWLGFTAGHDRPVAFGPVCGLCATTK